MDQNDLKQQAERARAQQEQEAKKQEMIRQLLTQEANERLGRVTLSRPEKAQEVSEKIFQMASSGKITQKIDDARLMNMLSEASDSQIKITFLNKKKKDPLEEELDALMEDL